jgi:hypothetical protein
MSTPAEEDVKLAEAFAALEPEPAARARMQVRVLEGHAQRSRALWREWLDLLYARPLANGALIAAAGLALFFTTPLGLLPSLLRAASGAPLSSARAPHHSLAQVIGPTGEGTPSRTTRCSGIAGNRSRSAFRKAGLTSSDASDDSGCHSNVRPASKRRWVSGRPQRK